MWYCRGGRRWICCSVVAALLPIPVFIIWAFVALVIIPAGRSTFATMTPISVPKLPFLTMLATSIVEHIPRTFVTLVVPPVIGITGLTAIIVPIIFGAVVAFIIPPVSIVTGDTMSPFVLFLIFGAFVAASVVPVVVVAARLGPVVPVLVARALVTFSSPVVRGVAALVAVPVLIVGAVVTLPIVPTIGRTVDVLVVVIMVVLHVSSSSGFEGGRGGIDDRRQDGEGGDDVPEKHYERMFLSERESL